MSRPARRTRQTTKEELRQQIARNLRNARNSVEPKLTQSNVAQMFNPPLTRAAVAQWEGGEAMPDIDRLAILSKAYGCTIDSLIFGDDHLKNQKGDIQLSPEALKLARAWMKLERGQRHNVMALILSMTMK